MPPNVPTDHDLEQAIEELMLEGEFELELEPPSDDDADDEANPFAPESIPSMMDYFENDFFNGNADVESMIRGLEQVYQHCLLSKNMDAKDAAALWMSGLNTLCLLDTVNVLAPIPEENESDDGDMAIIQEMLDGSNSSIENIVEFADQMNA